MNAPRLGYTHSPFRHKRRGSPRICRSLVAPETRSNRGFMRYSTREMKTDVASLDASGRGLRCFFRSPIERMPTGNYRQLTQSHTVNSYKTISIDRGRYWSGFGHRDQRTHWHQLPSDMHG